MTEVWISFNDEQVQLELDSHSAQERSKTLSLSLRSSMQSTYTILKNCYQSLKTFFGTAQPFLYTSDSAEHSYHS